MTDQEHQNEPAEDSKSSHSHQPPENLSWFERNPALIVRILVISCIALLGLELLFKSRFFDEHHPAHFEMEHIFGYQALIGFVAFVTVVYIGKGLRLVLKRPEDYYDG